MANELAKIHIAKKALGLDDETYRALLQRVAGVRSARELDAAGCAQVLKEFRAAGWKPTPPRAAAARVQATDPQSRKIRALWLALYAAEVVRDPSEKALAHYVRRQTGVERLHWLDARQARQVIESLKGWAARANVSLES